MTKADLIDEVSKLAELTRKDSEVIVETIFDSIVRSLRVGDKIEIRGFGSFRTRQRKPRVGRNPKTGERVEVPAKKIPFFKPSKELKDLVNTGGGHAAPPALQRRQLQHRRSARHRTDVGADASSAQPSKARLIRPLPQSQLSPPETMPSLPQSSNRYRQPESFWPGAPRIEIKHAIFRFLFGHVAVSVDYDGKSSRFRFQIKLLKIVQHVDRDAANFEHIREGNFVRPGLAIDVAANRSNRCNLGQLFRMSGSPMSPA